MLKLRSASAPLLLSMALALSAPSSSTAFLYNWPVNPTVNHPHDSDLSGGQDIVAAWHAYDGTDHYFRIDLRSAPDFQNFAGLYGVFINAHAGGASGPQWSFVPDALTGIDFILSSLYEPLYGSFGPSFYHQWNGSAFAIPPVAPSAVSQSKNNGTTLEWKISDADFGANFTWWAATHDVGSITATYNITDAITAVPIPGAALLFGSGILVAALAFRRRRQGPV